MCQYKLVQKLTKLTYQKFNLRTHRHRLLLRYALPITCLITFCYLLFATPVTKMEKDKTQHRYQQYQPYSKYRNSCSSQEIPDARPPPAERLFKSSTVERLIEDVGMLIKDDWIRQIFANCFPSTLDSTVLYHVNVSESPEGIPYTYIITGDISAMWLRDSTNQIEPYVPLAAKDPQIQELVLGVINTQAEMINLYPYGNAFYPLKHWNSSIFVRPSPVSANDTVFPRPDHTEVYEAKYELDSMASFLYLSKIYYESTKDASFLLSNLNWIDAVNTTLLTMREQQAGTFEVLRKEPYRFMRLTRSQSETHNLFGRGNPAKRCRLVRSFFRPSDDSTVFQFHIPSNALTAVGLEGTAEIFRAGGEHSELMQDLLDLAGEIRQGIEDWGIVQHPIHGQVYAYEVDCYGSHILMDDANHPSILSLPKFGFVHRNDEIYRNSRKYILSPDWNPYYFAGKYPGMGSLHTGLQKPWPMALAMQAMTSDDEVEIVQLLTQLRNTTAGTGVMHESYDVSNPCSYTRPWFAWANTVFGNLILHLVAERPHLLAGEQPKPGTGEIIKHRQESRITREKINNVLFVYH